MKLNKYNICLCLVKGTRLNCDESDGVSRCLNNSAGTFAFDTFVAETDVAKHRCPSLGLVLYVDSQTFLACR